MRGLASLCDYWNRRSNRKVGKALIPIVMLVASLLPCAAFAERPSFVPPPFVARLLSSLLTTVPVGVLLTVGAYSMMRIVDRTTCVKKRNVFLVAVVSVVSLAAIAAASDSWNHELWSPWQQGGISGGLIFPLAVVLLNDKLSLRWRIVIAILITYPLVWLSAFIAHRWQDLGRTWGLPTTW